MLTDSELLELAGKAALAKGRVYHADGRIRLSQRSAEALRGEALGTEVYSLWLKRDGARWRWNCICPAADGGAFCKHLVAAVLTARDGAVAGDDDDDDEDDDDAAAGDDRDNAAAGAAAGLRRRRARSGAVAARADDLLTFLRAQPAERLAGWLRSFANADSEIDKRLRLYRAADDPATLRPALAKLLAPGGFLDWRGSTRYAQRLDVVIEQLEAKLESDADACRLLCEYSLGRLFRIYARSDDSSGAIGGQIEVIAQLHARACAAAPPGKALAKPLFALQQHDEWGMLPLADYWKALGNDGQHAYEKSITTEIARLPETPVKTEHHDDTFGVLYRGEAFAHCAGDFDLLQRVLRRDLSHPYAHWRVIESLREFGREREALAFAEAAVKRFPSDDRLRDALADCLQQAGLGDEAVEQSWESFRLSPDEAAWDALKRIAATTWPQWRERALAQVAAAEEGNASLRVGLLLHDGDVDAAVALARNHGVWPQTLQQLAEQISFDLPTVAGEFYLRLVQDQAQRLDYSSYPRVVAYLQRAARLAPEAVWRPVVAALRVEHARKSRLMALLDEAGL